MALTVDVISGSSYSRDKLGGKYTRVFHITGITGSTDAMLYYAQQAVGINYYDPHPSIPGLYAVYIEAVPFPSDSKTAAKVRVTYTTALGVRWKMGATAQQLKTRIDQAGKYLNVKYTSKGAAATTTWNAAEIPILAPGLTLTFEREEPAANAEGVLPYLRCTNSVYFQGAPPGSWFCREITAESLNNGMSTDFSYTFEYKPPLPGGDENTGTNWYILGVYVDQNTRRTPTDIDDFTATGKGSNPDGTPNGWTLFNMYPQVDFTALNLPIIIP